MSLILKQAPHFSSPAVIEGKVEQNFSLEQYLDKSYVVLFFYPKDFSGVCPTEFWAFQDRLKDFQDRNAVVVGCSTDTDECHKAWLRTPRKDNGIEGITFPLVADMAKTIAMNYGVLGGEYGYDDDGRSIFEGSPICLRGTFIIDKKGVVMYESKNFYTIARDVDAVLRELDAIQNFQINGELCLANWKKK